MAEASGRLSSLKIYNENWGRGSISADDGTRVRVIGQALVGLVEGTRYRMMGRFVVHPTHGRQLEVSAASPDIPCNEEALRRFLVKNFKGCGEATARKVIEAYRGKLAELRDILTTNPESLDFSGITTRRIEAKEIGGLDDRIYRDLSSRIGVAGVNDSVVRRIAKYLHELVKEYEKPIDQAWSIFSRNPYELIKYIDGYGFKAADLAGKHIEFPTDHPYRLAALASQALRDGCERSGHAFLSLAELQQSIASFDASVDPIAAVNAAIDNGEPIHIEQDEYFYPKYLYEAEKSLADNLADRMARTAKPISDLPLELLHHQIRMGEKVLTEETGREFVLDASQRDTVVGLMTSTSYLHSVTAGPGCGKTALMEILTYVAQGKKILFCAPTGKAAKVLSGRVKRFGLSASTIHSMLGVTEAGFTFNALNPLDADIVIVDESSMVDLELGSALLEAIPYAAHVIFLGDPGQLQSVGPGQLLYDLLRLQMDHYRLSTTHRNDGGILEVVQQAGAGEVDCIDRKDVRFSHQLPPADGGGMERIINCYMACVERAGIEKVGLLMPKRKGDIDTPSYNTTYLNEVLREKFNANGEKVVGTRLRVGDRIIVRKNMALESPESTEEKKVYDSVVNGDTGFITGCILDDERTCVKYLMLALDDGREIRYPGSEMDKLGLAYAMTVHSSQGSEYQYVIFVCTDGMPAMAHRGIVYTAFSRAKDRLWVYADDSVLRKMVRREIPARNSLLVERVVAATQ